ncbi:type VI secretion system-associated protein TagF [Polyangium sp. y55x31]|uniref:type VI secretion system-associated protein TagF n=1 Tax=Polyangium sp. y55x31 TaxID=3042688 RepID=UPI0024826D5D|nr:type VI secretion system-associated protein TagF [Polyangium sp. y55x31]MDI1476159.1 type VI secretion system-associated protein TagF [Polyangium sp. y55x31]
MYLWAGPVMFWRKKKAPAIPPQIGCFGKLPATGDFIRFNAGGDELAAFDRWLGGGLDFARRAMGTSFEAAYQPSVGLFIFHGEGKDNEPPTRGMVGAWAASGDNAGRTYPMVVFASYDYGQLVSAGASLPIALWSLLASSYEIATSGRTLPVDAFVDRVSRIVPPSLEDADAAGAGYRSWLTTQSMKALWETGFGTDAGRFWVLQNVFASVEPFMGQENPKTGLCIRLPLGAGDAYAAAVWMDMTLRLARWKNTLLNAFWVPQQTMLLHLGPPHVASFRELIAPTGYADHIVELCRPPTVDEPTSRRALGVQLDALVARSELTISGFLDGLGQ